MRPETRSISDGDGILIKSVLTSDVKDFTLNARPVGPRSWPANEGKPPDSQVAKRDLNSQLKLLGIIILIISFVLTGVPVIICIPCHKNAQKVKGTITKVQLIKYFDKNKDLAPKAKVYTYTTGILVTVNVLFQINFWLSPVSYCCQTFKMFFVFYCYCTEVSA